MIEEEWNMTNRFISEASALVLALGSLCLTTLPMAGQVTNITAKSDLPRTPDGRPDLQGTYDLATMTPLERWPGDPPFLTKEGAEALQKAEIERGAESAGGDQGGFRLGDFGEARTGRRVERIEVDIAAGGCGHGVGHFLRQQGPA